jgi:hypothetical protein
MIKFCPIKMDCLANLYTLSLVLHLTASLCREQIKASEVRICLTSRTAIYIRGYLNNDVMCCMLLNYWYWRLFRSILNKVYNILTAPTNVSNTTEGGRGISLSVFTKLMQCYKPMRGSYEITKCISIALIGTVRYHIHGHDIIMSVESEVLCIFKVLVGCNNQDQDQIHNQTISRERFLTFYEVRDLKWKQARTI